MKQKLLLALMVFFASAGMMKVHGQVTVTPLDADQQITISKSGGLAWDNTTNFGVTPISVSANSVSLKGSGFTIPLQPTTGNPALPVTVLTISGKVKVVDNLSSTSLTSLSISGGELITLGTLPSTITSLSLSGNKLAPSALPKKTVTMTTYNVGSQKPDGITTWTTASAGLSNEGWDVKTSVVMGGITDQPVSLSGWSKLNTSTGQYVGNGEPQKNTSGSTGNTSRYYFMSGNIFMDGTYKYNTITFDANSDYPGVTYTGIEGIVTVDIAEFELLEATINPKNSGTVLIYSKDPVSGQLTLLTPSPSEKVKKGTILTYIPKANTGFVFSSFTANSSILAPYGTSNPTNQSQDYTVVGSGNPTLTANFQGQNQKITYDTNITGGTLRITNNETGATISSGSSVPSGTVLKIEATPSVGYSILNTSKLLVNGSILDIKNAVINSNGVLTANYTVAGDDLIVGITFNQSSGRDLTIKFKKPDVSGLFVDNANGTDPGDDPAGYAVRKFNVEVGSKPQIIINTLAGFYVTSITANSNTVTYTNTSNGILISNYTIPNEAVIMVIETAQLQKIEVNAVDKYTYDGTQKALQFTTDPLNISGFKVEYKISTNNDATYTPSPFKDASPTNAYYTARITRPADATFGAVNKIVTYGIEKATPRISSLPTVNILKDTNDPTKFRYTITGGSAQYSVGTGYGSIPYGKWEVIAEDTGVIPPDINTPTGKEILTDDPSTRMVIVRYTATNSTGIVDTNFEQAAIAVQATYNNQQLGNVTVRVINPLPSGVTSIKMFNGQQEINNGTTVKAKTQVTFKVVAPGFDLSTIKIQRVDNRGGAVGSPFDPEVGTPADGTEMIFTVIGTRVGDLRLEAYVKSGIVDNTKKYTGSGIYFDTSLIQLVEKDGTPISVAPVLTNNPWRITYKNSLGQAVVAPINAGTYTIEINRNEDSTNDNQHFKAISGTANLVVLKADPVILDWPSGAYVAPGQKLSAAVFVGGSSNVAGLFAFIDGETTPIQGTSYNVKFIPNDKVNYNEVIATNPNDRVTPQISNKRFVAIEAPVNGTITVIDNLGYSYKSGDEIKANATSLKITATPNAGFTLATLLVNDTNFTSGNSYTLPTNGSVTVKATFGTGTQFTVTLPTPPRGVAIVERPTSNVVVAGGSYRFKLAYHANDAVNVFDEDGIEIVGSSDGVYTLTNILKAKTISIKITNPTQIQVKFADDKYNRGTITGVLKDATRATTGDFYYGDVIILTATAKEGNHFVRWWDNVTTNPREFTIVGPQEFSATFDIGQGNIEPVEGLEVYGGEGHVFVSVQGEATVTVVGMNGKATKTKVYDQEYINVSTGIYGVIVEQGDRVSKVKVVVR